MDVARPLLHAADLVDDDVSYWEVKQALQGLSDKQQHHAVWIMILARREECTVQEDTLHYNAVYTVAADICT